MLGRTRILVGLAALVPLGASRAAAEQAPLPGSGTASSARIPSRLNLRIGGASSDHIGRPIICVDVRIVSELALESCGSGAELLHHEEGRQLAHVRATWALLHGALPGGGGRLRAGLGLAELQIGDDRPGLQLGALDDDRTAVAGPEAVAQAQYLAPLGRGIEAVASVTTGVAYFAHARELGEPQHPVQPFVSVEVGLGW